MPFYSIVQLRRINILFILINFSFVGKFYSMKKSDQFIQKTINTRLLGNKTRYLNIKVFCKQMLVIYKHMYRILFDHEWF